MKKKYLVRTVNSTEPDINGNIEVSGGGIVEVSKSELDNLIATSALSPGVTYRISGVHSTLYDDGTMTGTAIYLQALTTNTLASTGQGEFWNPKYDQNTAGFGIFDPTVEANFVLNDSYQSALYGNIPLGASGQDLIRDSVGNMYLLVTTGSLSCDIRKIYTDGTSELFASIPNNGKNLIVDSNDVLHVMYNLPPWQYGIHTLDSDGNIISTLETYGVPLYQMTIDPDDNIYVAVLYHYDTGTATYINEGSIDKFSFDGVLTRIIVGMPPPNNPVGVMLADSLGNIYAIAGQVIDKIDSSGVKSTYYTTTNWIYTAAIDLTTNYIYYLENTSKMIKITAANTFVEQYPSLPSIVTINSIWRFEINGNDFYIGQTGSIAMLLNDGSNKLASLNGATAKRMIIDNPEQIYWLQDYNTPYKLTVGPSIFEIGDFVNSNTGGWASIESIESGIVKLKDAGGSWKTATLMTKSSGSNATISSVDAYDTGDTVIWGGYSWTNINGNQGASSTIFNLDNQWSKNQYSITNYNFAIDVIEYDYQNDWISRRRNIASSNDVIYTKDDSMSFASGLHAISLYQFGNSKKEGGITGVYRNTIHNSIFECINFNGTWNSDNRLSQRSRIASNTGIKTIGYNSLTNHSKIVDSEFYGSGTISDNTLNASQLTNVSFEAVLLCKLDLTNIVDTTAEDNEAHDRLLQYLTFDQASIENLDLSDAAVLFLPFPKTVYNRSDNTAKIRYYNQEDALVINDIDD